MSPYIDEEVYKDDGNGRYVRIIRKDEIEAQGYSIEIISFVPEYYECRDENYKTEAVKLKK